MLSGQAGMKNSKFEFWDHYCLKPKAEIVLDIFDNAFFDGFSEIKKAVKAESEEEND